VARVIVFVDRDLMVHPLQGLTCACLLPS